MYSDIESAKSIKSVNEAEARAVEIPKLEAEYSAISIDSKGSMMLLCHSKGVELYSSPPGEDNFQLKFRVSGNGANVFKIDVLDLISRNCGFLTRNNFYLIGHEKNILMKFKGSTIEAKHTGTPYKISNQNLIFVKNMSQDDCKFLPWTSSNSDVSLIDKESFKVKKFAEFWLWRNRFGLTKPEPVCTTNANGSNSFVGLAVFKASYYCLKIHRIKDSISSEG